MKMPVLSPIPQALSRFTKRLKKSAANVFRAITRKRLNSLDLFVPRVNLYELPDTLVYELDLPGIGPDEIIITANRKQIMVQGERSYRRNENKHKWLWNESLHGAFRTSFDLPERVDTDSVRADYWNGVLRITVQKCAWAVSRRIPVKAGGQLALAPAS